MVHSYLRQLPLFLRRLEEAAIATDLAVCGIDLREKQRMLQLLSLPQHHTERVQQLRQLVRLMCEQDAAAALPVVNVRTLQERAANIAALQQGFA
jgi:hypothetical protein